ncbi:MAG: DUF1743 domain-containing protein [Candidatus Bathyarchaeota archaeon]|nr:MAG: DUF1743 domain-containing protein [Candidatus Bathyarchaeota archaeon]
MGLSNSRGLPALLLHIGLDDTDSPSGGCTTYIAARLVERLLALGGRFIDYPNLLRLNPNVPWKTRGNGAICLRLDIDPRNEVQVKRVVIELVEAYSEFDCANTNPGAVFLVGDVPDSLIKFSKRVVTSVVSLEDAFRLIDETGAFALGYKNMRGIIGSLAAVGGLRHGDHTFEFLAYRELESCGTLRVVDADSVRMMDEETRGSTFNNLDPETGRVLIAPHGPDPVLFGVRGESPEAVYRAGLMVSSESIERWTIFRTNQGTDAHLQIHDCLSELEPYSPATVHGEVVEVPQTIQGGHVVFSLEDDTAVIDCAAYEPSGSFRDTVRSLIPGDEVTVSGGVRGNPVGWRLTLNLEKLEVRELTRDVRLVNPVCPNCEGGMESMGRGKGFRCRRCGFRDGELEKRRIEMERTLTSGLYLPPPRAQRHLTKPLQRYGKEKHGPIERGIVELWHWP